VDDDPLLGPACEIGAEGLVQLGLAAALPLALDHGEILLFRIVEGGDLLAEEVAVDLPRALPLRQKPERPKAHFQGAHLLGRQVLRQGFGHLGLQSLLVERPVGYRMLELQPPRPLRRLHQLVHPPGELRRQGVNPRRQSRGRTGRNGRQAGGTGRPREEGEREGERESGTAHRAVSEKRRHRRRRRTISR